MHQTKYHITLFTGALALKEEVLASKLTCTVFGQPNDLNMLHLAQWLQDQPAVKKVSHPSLSSHPSHARAKKYFR